jgi:hypothetical protein
MLLLNIFLVHPTQPAWDINATRADIRISCADMKKSLLHIRISRADIRMSCADMQKSFFLIRISRGDIRIIANSIPVFIFFVYSKIFNV